MQEDGNESIWESGLCYPRPLKGRIEMGGFRQVWRLALNQELAVVRANDYSPLHGYGVHIGPKGQNGRKPAVGRYYG